MKIRITAIHDSSAWNKRKDIVGKVFEATDIEKCKVGLFIDEEGWFSAYFKSDFKTIYGFKYEVVEPSSVKVITVVNKTDKDVTITFSEIDKLVNEPSPSVIWADWEDVKYTSDPADAMRYATLMLGKFGVNVTTATASPDCKITVKNIKPKKKSWIEKIRGYDDLQARCNSAEAMRDHYKTSLESWESLAITKTRELELMSKVADNWQNKLVDANKLIEDIHNENTILGKRLKFSVGHNHIEIIVGNPVTACYFHSETVDSDFNEDFLAVSILHKNDTYDWKRGAIEALDNMVHNWIGSAYGDPTDYFNALFTTYPEIGIQPVDKKPAKKTKKVSK
jgi:hypothetical protein